MFEQGLVMLLQADPAVASVAASGGFGFGELPEGTALPAWCYAIITKKPEYTLAGRAGLIDILVQFDVFGQGDADFTNSGKADCIRLAEGITAVLSGYRGALPDPDRTFIDSCFAEGERDETEPLSRRYRRILEFKFWVCENV
jgi:hypothetical protein